MNDSGLQLSHQMDGTISQRRGVMEEMLVELIT